MEVVIKEVVELEDENKDIIMIEPNVIYLKTAVVIDLTKKKIYRFDFIYP